MFQKIIDNLFNGNKEKPLAIQCLWNSDYEYIGLTVTMVFKEFGSYRTKEIIELEYKNFESTEAMAAEAERIATEYVDKYHIELYFPSPDEWSRDCPNWWESKSSPKCEDCNTPIIPSDSEYLPKEVCYPCHLERKSNQKIINAEPYDDGVTMYLSKNDEHRKIGYCSYFEDFTIAPFIKHKVASELADESIQVITLEKWEILELDEELKEALKQKLEHYVKPVINDDMKTLVRTYKVAYNGVEYELEAKFNNTHNEISKLIHSLKTNQEALNEDYTYEIYFKKGITHRDDSILRFINYVSKGKTGIESICEHYKKILSEIEVLKAVEKLERMGCVALNGCDVTITTIGRNIV